MSPKPQSEHLLERKKRLSGRRPRVTFVIGFHCYNGVVLCADSEENDRVNKTYVEKLYVRPVPENWQVCFGGAGDAVAIEKFRDKLWSRLQKEPSNEAKIERDTEEVLEHMEGLYPESGFDILMAQIDLGSG